MSVPRGRHRHERPHSVYSSIPVGERVRQNEGQGDVRSSCIRLAGWGAVPGVQVHGERDLSSPPHRTPTCGSSTTWSTLLRSVFLRLRRAIPLSTYLKWRPPSNTGFSLTYSLSDGLSPYTPVFRVGVKS